MDVLMPQLGETVAEGKITKWFKSAGDAVKPGDNLFEIETDKVSMEVPSTSGRRARPKSAFNAGEVATSRRGGCGDRRRGRRCGSSARSAGATARRRKPAAPAASRATAAVAGIRPVVAQRASDAAGAALPLDPFFEVRTPERNYGPAKIAGGIAVTPLARRLASESGIDLSRITGSGPHGRVVARDIESAPRPAAPRAALAEGPTADQVKALYAPGSYEEVPLDGMRRTIAARLTQATQTIPHFYLTADIEIDRLLALREEANAAAPKDKDGRSGFQALCQ